jgi:hypothetical protein
LVDDHTYRFHHVCTTFMTCTYHIQPA